MWRRSRRTTAWRCARWTAGRSRRPAPRSPPRPTAPGRRTPSPAAFGLGNVLMGPDRPPPAAARSASRPAPSRVAPGADYAAGITALGAGGELDFDDDGSTNAPGRLHQHPPRQRHADRRLRPPSPAPASLTDDGLTAFTSGSQTTIADTLHLRQRHRHPAAPTPARHHDRPTGTSRLRRRHRRERRHAEHHRHRPRRRRLRRGAGRERPAGVHGRGGRVDADLGAVSVASELEVAHGTLRALDGGTLYAGRHGRRPGRQRRDGLRRPVQRRARPGQRADGARLAATGSGTIRFEAGPSRVAPGADYAAGITALGAGGELDFDDDGSTNGLRLGRLHSIAAVKGDDLSASGRTRPACNAPLIDGRTNSTSGSTSIADTRVPRWSTPPRPTPARHHDLV